MSRRVAWLQLFALIVILAFDDGYSQEEFPQAVQRPQKYKSTSITMDKHLKELEELERKKKAKPKYQYAKVEADGRVHVNGIPIMENQATANTDTGGIYTRKGTMKKRPTTPMVTNEKSMHFNDIIKEPREHPLSVNNITDDDYVQMNTPTTSDHRSSGGSRRLTTAAEDAMNAIQLDPSLTLYVEPEDGYFSEKAMAVFVRCSNPSSEVRIYYELSRTVVGIGLTFNPLTQESNYRGYDDPYIQIDNPFTEGTRRNIQLQAVFTDAVTLDQRKSEIITRRYFVEAAARPGSFMFLAPGVETGGRFVSVALEMEAAAR